MADMTVTSAAGSALFGQLQQQQAQRTADQAEARARALQAQARQAQGVADRAALDADTLKSRSRQARSQADDAQRNLNALDALNQTQAGLTRLQSEVRSVVATLEQPLAAVAPVVNLYGEETGTQVNVTA